MGTLLRRALGIPATEEHRARAMANLLSGREPANAMEFLFTVMSHNTGKAGALLAAQGMFAVVGTYGMEHGWIRGLVLPSMLLLMVGALLGMSILHVRRRSSVCLTAPPADRRRRKPTRTWQAAAAG